MLRLKLNHVSKRGHWKVTLEQNKGGGRLNSVRWILCDGLIISQKYQLNQMNHVPIWWMGTRKTWYLPGYECVSSSRQFPFLYVQFIPTMMTLWNDFRITGLLVTGGLPLQMTFDFLLLLDWTIFWTKNAVAGDLSRRDFHVTTL